MDKQRLKELAGVVAEATEQEKILETLGARDGAMVDQILKMAEARAYDEGAESGNATSDMVFAAAQQILGDIEQAIGQKLETEMSGGMSSDEMDSIEHRMGADRNMEMGETNFKAG